MDIDKCWLQKNPSNRIRNFIRTTSIKIGLAFFDYKNNRKTFKIINTTNIFTNLFIFIIIGFLINYFSPLISEKIFDDKINSGLI